MSDNCQCAAHPGVTYEYGETDDLDDYIAEQMANPSFARAYRRASRVTGGNVHPGLAWFRVHGYGLWVKWGRGRDLFSTRRTAHYWGRLRWKILRPDA